MLKLSADAATSAVDALCHTLDGGEIIIWSGSRPATLEASVTTDNGLLATFTLADPAFGEAMLIDDAVEAIAAQIALVSASQTGAATFFRAYDSDGVPVMEGSVGLPDDTDADIHINQTQLLSGADVSVTRFAIGIPIA